MSQIASKNLYELLGNDPELDPNREPQPPTKAIDKAIPRTGKRTEAPARDSARPAAGGRGASNATAARGDQAAPRTDKRDDGFRRDRPRGDRPAGDRSRGGRRGGRGEFRGGARGANRDDRKSHSGVGEHEKQAAHGWGGETGQAEWNDEKAGDAIAQAEAKNDAGLTGETDGADPAFASGPNEAGEADAAEPEDNSKSYDEYRRELEEKRQQLSGETLAIRKPNEGSKQKFPEGKAIERVQDDYYIGGGGKAKREKEQKQKEFVSLDSQYYVSAEQERPSGGRGGRGGRGGPRGGRSERGRGAPRGGRPEGGRDGPRGGARGGARGGPRGGFNATDSSAFPALGA